MMTSDIFPLSELESIKAEYKALALKYYDAAPHVSQMTALNYVDVRDDLNAMMRLKHAALKLDPSSPLIPSLISIFFSQDAIFSLLSPDNLIQLCLESDASREEATTFFQNKLNKNKINIKGLLNYYTKPTTVDDKKTQYYEMALFLLCVPRHAEMFDWPEVIDVFKHALVYALKLVCHNINSFFQKAFIRQIDQHQTPVAHKFLIAASSLSKEELNQLFQTPEDKKALFVPMSQYAFIEGIKPSAILQTWMIKQLLTLSQVDGKLYQSSFENALAYTAKQNPKLFLEQNNLKEILVTLGELGFIRLLDVQGVSINTKHELLNFIISDSGDYLDSLGESLAAKLCETATAEQLSILLLNKNIKQKLVETKTSEHTRIFNLLLSCGVEKAKNIKENHVDLLKNLTPKEVLALATSEQEENRLSISEIELLLKEPAFINENKGKNTIDGSKLRGINFKLFKTLTTSDIYKEAWIRDVVQDPKWNSLGIGFFCRKTPTGIVKARKFLTDKQETSLSKSELKELIHIFQEAKQISHNYSYFFGSIDLRDRATQNFYDRAADFSTTLTRP